MPRKSNKTAHVLGLITNEKSAASPEEEEVAVQSPKPVRKAVVRKNATATMESQGDNNMKLSEDIRSKLLEELDGPEVKPQESEQKISSYHPYAPDANIQNLPDESPSSVVDNNLSELAESFSAPPIPDTEGMSPNEFQFMDSMPEPNSNFVADNIPVETTTAKPLVKTVVVDYPLEDFDAKEPEMPAIQPAPAMQPAPMAPTMQPAPMQQTMQPAPMQQTMQPAPMQQTMTSTAPTIKPMAAIHPTPNTAAAEALAAHSPYVPPAHATYIYINVLEELIKERTLAHMKTFDMCLCNRCVMDTMALALTRLPAKYVVVEKGEGIPLLNYYGAHFQIQVVTELTKACMAVKSSPHH